jgi:hypothetical protein
MNIYVSHSSEQDYQSDLYAPIKASALYRAHHFFLPHEPENKDAPAAEVLKQADVIVAEVSYPSTGQGIELGLASVSGVRILCFYKSGAKPSSSLRFITNSLIEYHDTQDLLSQLAARLGERVRF